MKLLVQGDKFCFDISAEEEKYISNQKFAQKV